MTDAHPAPAESGGDLRSLVEMIAKSLVDNPDEVSVEAADEDEETTVLELRVAPGDIGKVIGKQGRTARAVRSILSAASVKLRRRYELEILE